VTVTTVGYGDAVPQTSAGRLVAAVAMVTGVVGISTIISIMTQEMATVRESQPAFNGGGYTGGGAAGATGRARVDVTCGSTSPLMAPGGCRDTGGGGGGSRHGSADAEALVQMDRRLARLEALLERINASMDGRRNAQAPATAAAPIAGGAATVAATPSPSATNPLAVAEMAAQAACPTERL